MNETKLLNNTIRILESQGVVQAYSYLLAEKSKVSAVTGQLYNYLCCFAALSNKKKEALSWLEEAIIKKGYWYRPSVFEDSDLESLFEEKRFKLCKDISFRRYSLALKKTKTVCTWKSVASNTLFLVLHGNQQNIYICKEDWKFLNNTSIQVEYLQSEEIDSKDLYRWSEDGNGAIQLKNSIESIKWNEYSKRVLCGFSAGCNVILNALAMQKVQCEQIILVSPWIPIVNDIGKKIINYLLDNKIKVLFICGQLDEDCKQFKPFVDSATSLGVYIHSIWINNLGHEFPENFSEIIKRNIDN